jgi:uncharacterized protein YggL (DUF469 family)
MKKRLRKKRHLGEFREDGFSVSFHLAGDALSQDEQLDFLDSIITEAIEPNGLDCGGGGGNGSEWYFFITRSGRGSTMEADRTAVLKWLEGQAIVRDISVGPLVDAWWGWGK